MDERSIEERIRKEAEKLAEQRKRRSVRETAEPTKPTAAPDEPRLEKPTNATGRLSKEQIQQAVREESGMAEMSDKEKSRQEAEERRRAEQTAREKAEAEKKARKEAEIQARLDRQRQEQEAKEKAEAEKKAQKEAEIQARLEKQRQEQEAKEQAEAEKKARKEAEKLAKLAAGNTKSVVEPETVETPQAAPESPAPPPEPDTLPAESADDLPAGSYVMKLRSFSAPEVGAVKEILLNAEGCKLTALSGNAQGVEMKVSLQTPLPLLAWLRAVPVVKHIDYHDGVILLDTLPPPEK
jgi:hypothetical protein